MLRQVHSLPGLLAALLVVVMAVTGAVLSLNPAIDRAGAIVPPAGTVNVAALAEAAAVRHAEVDRIVRAASGSVSRLTRLQTAFSRVPGGSYVQERIAKDAAELQDLLRAGAQVMVCGGRGMARGVGSALGSIVEPLGIDLATLKSNGRYLEDVY